MTEGTVTFAEHIGELRKRLMWSMLFVVIGAGVGFAIHDWLLVVLQQPLHDKLYYTTPTGAFSFIIKVCAVFGIVVALPVLTYQIFAFFGPLIKARTKKMFIWNIFISVMLALAGIAFAYFISLPAALRFLVNFGGEGIESLITANEYFNFVLAYLAGFALLFQLPLILSFINRVTPLTPSKLIGSTRYVIVGSFIAAAVITPTPDPLNQALMAGPIILLYLLSASVIAFRNRTRKSATAPLLEPSRASSPLVPQMSVSSIPVPRAQPNVATPPPAASVAVRSPRRVNDIIVPGRNVAVSAYHQRRQPIRPSVQPVVQKSSPRPRLISDFVPVSE